MESPVIFTRRNMNGVMDIIRITCSIPPTSKQT
jgi:hypothetical protein